GHGPEGLLRTAAQEYPALGIQLVLVDAALASDPSALADALADAAAQAHLSPLRLSARDQRTLTWRVASRRDEAPAQPYREDGVYVVTGGLGGLGLLVAGDILAATRHARVVLTGRA